MHSRFTSGIAVAPEVQLTVISISKHLMSAAEQLEDLRQRLIAIAQEAGGKGFRANELLKRLATIFSELDDISKELTDDVTCLQVVELSRQIQDLKMQINAMLNRSSTPGRHIGGGAIGKGGGGASQPAAKSTKGQGQHHQMYHVLHAHDGAGSDVLHAIDRMGSTMLAHWWHTSRAVPYVWASKHNEWTYLGVWMVNLQTSEWSIQKSKTQHFYQDHGKIHYCRLLKEVMEITSEREKWVMNFKDTVSLLDTSNDDDLTPMVSSDSDSDFSCKSLPIEEEAESLSSESWDAVD